MITILEVYIVNSVSCVAAPVASLVALEAGATTLCETHFRAERLLTQGCRGLERELLGCRYFAAPGTAQAAWRNCHCHNKYQSGLVTTVGLLETKIS